MGLGVGWPGRAEGRRRPFQSRIRAVGLRRSRERCGVRTGVRRGAVVVDRRVLPPTGLWRRNRPNARSAKTHNHRCRRPSSRANVRTAGRPTFPATSAPERR